MKITTTQVSTFQDCPKKWYIHKVVGVSDLWTRNYLFGSVLHACLERWYLTRGTGIVPEHSDTWESGGPLFLQKPGDKVEIFPEGWEWHKDRDGSWDRLTGEEAIRVRAAVENGFKEKTVDVPEDAIIESSFKIKVIDGVELVSLADCMSLGRVEIQDHKSSSALKWLKSSKELATNLQLIIYATYLLSLFEEEPDTVLMRHNGYIKRAPFKTHVRYAEIDGNKHIPVSHVKEVWKEVQEIARQMVEASTLPIEEVPKTEDRGICSKYSGCPYKPHCHMNIGLDTVAKSITAQNTRAHTLTAMETPPIPGQATAPEPSISPPAGQPPFLKPDPQGHYIKKEDLAPAVKAWKESDQKIVVVPDQSPFSKVLKDGSTLWQAEPFPWAQASCGICKGSGTLEKSCCPSCVEFYEGPLTAPFLEVKEGGEDSLWLQEASEPAEKSETVEAIIQQSEKEIHQIETVAGMFKQLGQDLGLSSEQFLVDVRAMVRGTVSASNNRLPTALGITNEKIREAHECDEFLEFMGEKSIQSVGGNGIRIIEGTLADKLDHETLHQSHGGPAGISDLVLRTQAPEAVEEEKPKKRGRGRPKKEEAAPKEPIDEALDALTKQKASESFRILISKTGGTTSKKRAVISLGPVLEAAKSEIARRFKTNDFLEVRGDGGTPWMRREELAKLAPWVIKQLAGKNVTFAGYDDPEIQGILSRIEAAAEDVSRA